MNSAPARSPPPHPPRHRLQASKAVAAKIKDSLLDPKFIPRVLRPAAGFVVELVLPVSTICAIPDHIEKVKLGCFAATPSAQLFASLRAELGCKQYCAVARAGCVAAGHGGCASRLHPRCRCGGLGGVLYPYIPAAGAPPPPPPPPPPPTSFSRPRCSIASTDQQEGGGGDVGLRRSARAVVRDAGQRGVVVSASALAHRLARGMTHVSFYNLLHFHEQVVLFMFMCPRYSQDVQKTKIQKGNMEAGGALVEKHRCKNKHIMRRRGPL
jgi:hypothetical protein